MKEYYLVRMQLKEAALKSIASECTSSNFTFRIFGSGIADVVSRVEQTFPSFELLSVSLIAAPQTSTLII